MFTVPDMPVQDHPASLFHSVNNGPDFRAVAHDNYEEALPHDWRLSFGRVAPAHLTGDTAALTTLTVQAFDEFERTCALMANAPEWSDVLTAISTGVDASAEMRASYLRQQAPFSIRRLDVVSTADGPRVVENDEMPGGIAHAYHLDRAYGINQARWQRCFESLTADGPLVFVVSDEWSKPYIPELAWLAEHLRSLGYPVWMVSDSELTRLTTNSTGVYLDNQKIATVWRVFPVFEAKDRLAELVQAAERGLIRLTPEFASWGNKAWFGVFWQELDFFRSILSEQSFELLSTVIPYSATIVNASDFPQTVVIAGEKLKVESYQHLRALTRGQRAKLILKTAGAHNIAARCYGVLMGKSCKTSSPWASGVDELFATGAPAVLQAYQSPMHHQIPVWSALHGTVKLEASFDCRVLLRPWSIDGELVSCTAFALPNTVSKLHGTTQGAEIPLSLD